MLFNSGRACPYLLSCNIYELTQTLIECRLYLNLYATYLKYICT